MTDRQYLLAEQTIDEQDLRDLTGWLQTNPWLSQQRLVAEFERRWAAWLGVRHAVFVNSGSSANLLMFWTLLLSGRLRNRKVIVPAVCWPTTAAPAIQLGFEPILCESEPRTLGVDPNHLEDLLRAHDPAAVAIVHVLGVPNEMDAIDALKARFGFVLMEDACAAIGSQFDGRRAGTFGDLSTFSFFYGHQLSTIEGGMICTGDDHLHEILRQVRSHGWPKDLPPAHEARLAAQHGTPAFNRPFTFHHPGFNVRSTEVNARIGLSQLERLDAALARRVENHRLYQARFADQPGVRVPNQRARHDQQHRLRRAGRIGGPPRRGGATPASRVHRDAADRRRQPVAAADVGRALRDHAVAGRRSRVPHRVPAAQSSAAVRGRRPLHLRYGIGGRRSITVRLKADTTYYWRLGDFVTW